MQEEVQSSAPSSLTFLLVMAWCISLIVLGLFLFSLAARHFLMAELISSFRTQLAVMLLVCAVFLLLLRQRTFGWLAFAISVGQLLMLASIFIPSSQPSAGSQKIQIMSMNVWCENYRFEEVIDQVESISPDVLLVIEYNNRWHSKMRKLHSTYPHRVLQPRWHGYGIALFSKLPLENAEVWQLTSQETDVPALSVRVKAGEHAVRLVGLHTMSPTNSLRMRLRSEQMSEVTDHLASTEEPSMLIGDLNCTPWSPYLKDLAKTCGLRDSRQGQGYLASWNVDLPWALQIPIDHALVSKDVHVHRRYTGQSCGSDHLPTIIEISLAQ